MSIVSVQKYVLGFAIDAHTQEVLLIRKEHPAWQKGRLNGVGGKVEPGESSLDAMVREFYEETGLRLADNWEKYAIVGGPKGENDKTAWTMDVYRCFSDFSGFRKTTDEQPVAIDLTKALPVDILPNLKWLIPLAFDKLQVVASY